MTYGYSTGDEEDDTLVCLIEKMMHEFSQAAVPLAWLVDIVPILRHIPDWLPGSGFKHTARRWRSTVRAVGYVPYTFARQREPASVQHPSYVLKTIQTLRTDQRGALEVGDEDLESIVWTAASLYGGASDTTVVVLTAFCIAMILSPHSQKRAQDELDGLLGNHRLPNLQDRGRLPYTNALIKEVLRWWPIAPMGFPHVADQEIIYGCYRIPKGAYLIPCVRSFLHDPSVYKDPELFEPERFLAPRYEPDPRGDAFGYGRRVCPGKHFADSSIFLSIACLLSSFNLNRGADQNGSPAPIEAKPTPGILNYPQPFKYRLQVRSPTHAALINQVAIDNPWEPSDAEHLHF